MVDDVWITWHDDGSATLGPIVTGSAALLDQLGRVGNGLTRLSGHIGWSHARVWRQIPWTAVRRIEHPQVQLALDRADLPPPLDPAERGSSSAGSGTLYSRLSKLPVITRDHCRLGVIDVRTEQLIAQPPGVLGLIVGPHPRRRSFGLKHFDTTTIRLGGITRGGSFLPWQAVTRITEDAIHTTAASGELVPLPAAPAPQPPPMPEGATPP